MQNFQLNSHMMTLSGVFYPKGFVVIMFPSADDAAQVASRISRDHPADGDVMQLSPETVLREIGKIEGESDVQLPSVGTEAATVRKYVDLARAGHCALMVRVHSDAETERVMEAARKASFSYAQRYHLLAIEDLE